MQCDTRQVPGLSERKAFRFGKPQGDVALDREVRKEIEILEHDADVAAQLSQSRARAVGPVAIEKDLAAVRPLQAVDAAQKRGLARAAAADDGNDFTGLDAQRDVVQRDVPAEALKDAA